MTDLVAAITYWQNMAAPFKAAFVDELLAEAAALQAQAEEYFAAALAFEAQSQKFEAMAAGASTFQNYEAMETYELAAIAAARFAESSLTQACNAEADAWTIRQIVELIQIDPDP